MSGFAFYCSKCKVDHAGECPTTAVPVKVRRVYTNHDWVAQTVYDLSLPYQCSQCGLTHKVTLIGVMAGKKPEDLLPLGPCYPDLDDAKEAYLAAKKALFDRIDAQNRSNSVPVGLADPGPPSFVDPGLYPWDGSLPSAGGVGWDDDIDDDST